MVNCLFRGETARKRGKFSAKFLVVSLQIEHHRNLGFE